MSADTQSDRFQEMILTHLDAAYNLARWLVHNGTEAEDLVQEACLRAWKSFSGFRGENSRGWLLAIVRNTCYTWLRKNRRQELVVEFNEDIHTEQSEVPNPERTFAEKADRQILEKTLKELPAEFREAIVLRELEGLSYKEISEIAEVPIGTVMSRLARGRARLQRCLAARVGKEVPNALQRDAASDRQIC